MASQLERVYQAKANAQSVCVFGRRSNARRCSMKILLVQGANMSYLGKREPEIYGTTTAAELDTMLQERAKQGGYQIDIFYTHIEGEAIGRLYAAADSGIDAVV